MYAGHKQTYNTFDDMLLLYEAWVKFEHFLHLMDRNNIIVNTLQLSEMIRKSIFYTHTNLMVDKQIFSCTGSTSQIKTDHTQRITKNNL